jgi:hypothetical protein
VLKIVKNEVWIFGIMNRRDVYERIDKQCRFNEHNFEFKTLNCARALLVKIPSSRGPAGALIRQEAP